MRRFNVTIAAILALLLITLCCSRADARRRGFVLITHGDSVKHLGDVPSDYAVTVREMTGASTKVGYLHQGFGVFFCDIWTWGGEYCLYDDDNNVWALQEPEAAELLGIAESDLAPPMLYRFPPGLLLIGVLVAGYVAYKQFAPSREKKLKKIADDARYHKALEVMNAHYEQQEAANAEQPEQDELPDFEANDESGFEKGVEYLVSQGIERQEAEENLALLVTALASSR